MAGPTSSRSRRPAQPKRDAVPESVAGPTADDANSPWLTPDQQQVWRAFLQVSGALDYQLDRELQRDAGMPHAYYLILAMLSEAQDRALRMSQLAAAAWASPSRISHAVDRLERAGWVSRRPDERDRRGQVAVLTDLGRQHLESAAPGHARTVRRILFDRLSADQLTAFGEICRLALGELRGTNGDGAVGGGPACPS
jgi:DNA-binding MarR family transcriptional regulator